MKLKLRLAEETDAEFVFSVTQDKEYKKFVMPRLRAKDLEDQKKKIRSYLAQSKKQQRFYYLILSNNEKAGIIYLYNINKDDKRCSVGYGISKEFRGKGIGAKAVKLALDFAKKELQFHACEATVDPKNQPSKKVLEKNGFKSIGTIKEYTIINGKYKDREIYWKLI